jgi:hypothetical protein
MYTAARSEELRVFLMKNQVFWGIKPRLGLLGFEDGIFTRNILEDLFFRYTRQFLKLDWCLDKQKQRRMCLSSTTERLFLVK